MSVAKDTTNASTVALRALADPRSLVAIAALLFNDHVLKGFAPGFVTGKLSDVAGLVFFPILLAVLVGLIVRTPRRALAVSTGVTVGWFAAMKTLAPIASMTETMVETLVASSRIVVDPWDLIALPAVGLAAWIYRDAERRSSPYTVTSPNARKAAQVAVLIAATLATTATSCFSSDGLIGFQTQGDTVFAVYGDDDGRIFASNDGFETWEKTEEYGAVPDAPVKEECLPEGHCFRIDGGPRVEESHDGETWTIAWAPPAGRLAFLERQGDECDPYVVRSFSVMLTAGPDPVVLVAMGDDGLLRRLPDGTWERDVLDTAAPLARQGSHIEGETLAIAAFCLLLAFGAALAADSRLGSGGETVLRGWTLAGLMALVGTAFLLIGSAIGFLRDGTSLIALVPLYPMPFTFLLGLAGLASVWSGLRDLYPSTALRMALKTSGLIFLVFHLMMSSFYAWSAGWISHWLTAAGIAAGIGAAAILGIATLTSRKRIRPGEPLPAKRTTESAETLPGDGPSADEAAERGQDSRVARHSPWLAALALALALATSIILPFASLLAVLVAAYLAARWTGHERPVAHALVAAVLSGPIWILGEALVGLTDVTVIGSMWILAVLTIKERRRSAWVLRLIVLAAILLLGWLASTSAVAALYATLVPFAVVFADRLGQWWDGRRAHPEPSADGDVTV